MANPISPYANKLQGSHVLIIGGSSGIGHALASAVLSQGGSVTISSSSIARITSAILGLQATYPRSIIKGHVCNLSDSSTMEVCLEMLFAQTVTAVGPINHVVYTAADRLAMTPLENVTSTNIIAAGTLRFVGPLLTAKIASRYLAPSSVSSITLTGGSIASKPVKNWTIIAGYGAALEGVTRNLALEKKPIRVNVVEPGPVDSPLWDMERDEYEEFKRVCAQGTLTGRMGTVEEAVEAFMLCIRSQDIDGAVIKTDGGSIFV